MERGSARRPSSRRGSAAAPAAGAGRRAHRGRPALASGQPGSSPSPRVRIASPMTAPSAAAALTDGRLGGTEREQQRGHYQQHEQRLAHHEPVGGHERRVERPRSRAAISRLARRPDVRASRAISTTAQLPIAQPTIRCASRESSPSTRAHRQHQRVQRRVLRRLVRVTEDLAGSRSGRGRSDLLRCGRSRRRRRRRPARARSRRCRSVGPQMRPARRPPTGPRATDARSRTSHDARSRRLFIGSRTTFRRAGQRPGRKDMLDRCEYETWMGVKCLKIEGDR